MMIDLLLYGLAMFLFGMAFEAYRRDKPRKTLK